MDRHTFSKQKVKTLFTSSPSSEWKFTFTACRPLLSPGPWNTMGDTICKSMWGTSELEMHKHWKMFRWSLWGTWTGVKGWITYKDVLKPSFYRPFHGSENNHTSHSEKFRRGAYIESRTVFPNSSRVKYLSAASQALTALTGPRTWMPKILM